MKKSGIYIIFSKNKPFRFYIGSSINVGSRIKWHQWALLNKKHHSQTLQRHYNKYGDSDLEFSHIISCDKDNLYEIEKAYVNLLHPYFNSDKEVKHAGFGKSCPEYERKRKSELLKQLWEDPLFREKQKPNIKRAREAWLGTGNPNFGKPQPKEITEKISNTLKIFFSTEQGMENTKRVNEFNRGNSYHKGHTVSKESRKVMSEKALLRAPISEETRNKQKESALRAWQKRGIPIDVIMQVKFDILTKDSSGYLFRDIAIKNGLSESQVKRISYGKTYKNIILEQ
jgi:group I intron endonuclease